MRAMPDTESIRALLAFDFGLRRVGVSLGVTLTRTASPLTTIQYQSRKQLWNGIQPLVETWKPQLLVVGFPWKPDGSPPELGDAIQRFAAELRRRYDLPLELVNEQLSSLEASSRLKLQRQQGRRKKVKKTEIDQQAATILAETWLDSHA